jgi:hypothetical protein
MCILCDNKDKEMPFAERLTEFLANELKTVPHPTVMVILAEFVGAGMAAWPEYSLQAATRMTLMSMPDADSIGPVAGHA